MRAISTLVLVAAAASQLGSTDCGGGPVIRDPGFDLWCGDTLCAWTVETGSIEDVPTWHTGDHGVALLGDDAAIEQLSPVGSSEGTCIEFDLIANVSEGTSAVLNVDVFGDGTNDVTEQLPTGTWQPLTYQIRMPDVYSGIRFEIVKHGNGSAELANIGASFVSDGCAGQPPLVVTSRPLGVQCGGDGDCASGICAPSTAILFDDDAVCVGCDDTHACSGGDVCGLVEPTSPLMLAPQECVPPSTEVEGQLCATDAECSTGHCNFGLCSTCTTDYDCAAGEACTAAWLNGALECAPGEGHRATGEPCALDSDCASGTCAGAALSTCNDNRSCASAADCPFDDDFENSPCTPVGIQGGSCD